MEHGFMLYQTTTYNPEEKGVRMGLTAEFIQSVPETVYRESVTHQIIVMKDE